MPRWNMQDVRRGLQRTLADLAQPQQEPMMVPPPQGTPRIGMRGPMPDMLPGAWNAAGRGVRKPHWNDPSGKPYAPGPRPGIDYNTRGGGTTFDDWLMSIGKRLGW